MQPNKETKIAISKISWCTDQEDGSPKQPDPKALGLPKTVTVAASTLAKSAGMSEREVVESIGNPTALEDAVNDYLSDTYGYLVNGWSIAEKTAKPDPYQNQPIDALMTVEGASSIKFETTPWKFFKAAARNDGDAKLCEFKVGDDMLETVGCVSADIGVIASETDAPKRFDVGLFSHVPCDGGTCKRELIAKDSLPTDPYLFYNGLITLCGKFVGVIKKIRENA